MKAIDRLKNIGLSLILLTSLATFQTVQAQPGASISFQTFYQELAPYGNWINSPQYGSVWTPYVDQGFQPYSTNGYWEMTDYGNTWVSDYEWGWAPFHYGRWSFDNAIGWFWVPGYEWGPAWVNWRSGGGYYGWAPLGPGIGINVSINIPSFWWIFVPQRYFGIRNWHNYWVPRNRIGRIYNRTTIINNYYNYNGRATYAYGPRRDEIERVSRRSIPVRQIDASNRGRVIVASSSRGNNSNSTVDASAYNYDSRGNSNRASASTRQVEPYSGRSSARTEASSAGRASGSTYNQPAARANESYNGRSSAGVESSSPRRSNRSYQSGTVESASGRANTRSSEARTQSPQPRRQSESSVSRSAGAPSVRSAPSGSSATNRSERSNRSSAPSSAERSSSRSSRAPR